MKPERPEKKPPVRNANGTNQVRLPVAAITIRTTNMTAKKTATIVYWRLRYAFAPALMLDEIFAIFSVPKA